MKPYFRIINYGFFLLLLILPQSLSAYNIKVEIENCPDYYIYLGMHKGPDFEIIDSLPAKNGFVEFKADKKLQTGVYFIIIPPHSRFDFIIADNQDFTIKTNIRDILGKLIVDGEKQYSIFIELQKNIASINKQRSQLKMELDFYKAMMPDTVKFVEAKIDSLNSYQNSLYSDYKTKLETQDFLYKILNIMEPFNPPDSIKQLQFSNAQKHYKYYIEHFMDRIDFNDATLLNTPEFVFHQQLKDFCFYFFDTRANKINDVYPDLDFLISKTENNIYYRQYVLNYLIARYEQPKDLRLEAILVHVYRNYYLVEKPEWVSKQAYDIMKIRIEDIQYNVVGNIAKDLQLIDNFGNNCSVYGMDSPYKVLIFWDMDCDLCTESILKLQEEYKQLEAENLQVMAIYTGTDTSKWNSYINEKQLRWTNAYDSNKSSNFEQYYGTFKTPRLYILDSSNKIITKDIKPEHVYDYIKSYDNKLQKDKDKFDFMFGE